jgi:hypothetical protein
VPIPGLLDKPATAGQLGVLYDAAVSAIHQANGRTSDLVAIAALCQAKQVAILQALTPPPPWYRRIRWPNHHRAQPKGPS